MPVLEINGREVEVDDSFLSLTPEQQDATVEEIAGSMASAGSSPEPAPRNTPSNFLTSTLEGLDSGIFYNFDDEIQAGMMVPVKALGRFVRGEEIDIGGIYTELQRQFDQRKKNRREDYPISSFTGEAVGSLAGAGGLARAGLLASAKLPAAAGLGARTVAGIKDAAVAGAAFGAGSGTDLESRAQNALSTGLFGAAVGGAVPVVGSFARGVATPITNAIRARVNPSGFASAKVAERIAKDGTTIDQVSRRIGDGMNIADVAGENTRGLLRTTSNVSSAARNRNMTTLTLRQFGQGDRIKTAVADTFADPNGYLTAKDKLAEAAKQIASPLYDRAYANPVPFTRELEKILRTPAGNDALRRAVRIAKNEQAPFQQWFMNIADDGSVTIKRVPDMRAWDYIKRGMDDVIDGQTDSLTGKVSNAGRAVVGLKKRLLGLLDDANPDYKVARRAYGGIAQIEEALEFGRKAHRMSPEAIKRQVADMSVSEKEAARIGMAEYLRRQVDDAGFTHNAIQRVMGSRSKYQRLRNLFDTSAQFKEFRKTIFNEARKQRTFNAVRGNSTTAQQLADMQDAGQLSEVAGASVDVARGNIGGIVNRIGSFLAQRAGGLTDEVSDEVSRRLLSMDRTTLTGVLRDLTRIEQSAVAGDERRRLIEAAISRALTAQAAQ